jgi:GT2 family glycosyltransferase
MADRLPAVAVVVPVCNGAATIRTCVEALLALDYPAEAREIVVVDNRSTDDTRAIVSGYPVVLLEETAKQSSYAARNRGVAATATPLVAFTDADCVPDPGWLRALVTPFAAADAGGVAGGIEAYQARTAVERYQARRALRAERAFAHPVLPFAQTANAAYRRTVFERLGGFDASLVFGGDLDFAWRMQREGGSRLVFAPEALVRHRHRTTWRGLFRLYAKNAVANCLLARRYPHYAAYPELRTFAYLARECARSALRAAGGRPTAEGGPPAEHLAHAVRHAGEMWGWLRWHAGAEAA